MRFRKNFVIPQLFKKFEQFKLKAHDRFLIVDDTLWHIGASLKDAGLNLFAMMKMTLSPDVILSVL